MKGQMYMTDNEALANKEINMLKMTDRRLKAINDDESQDVKNLEMDNLLQELFMNTKTLRDCDGSRIDGFFKINAKDNYDLMNINHDVMTKHRIHLMIIDTIKAVQGDTNTLLRE